MQECQECQEFEVGQRLAHFNFVAFQAGTLGIVGTLGLSTLKQRSAPKLRHFEAPRYPECTRLRRATNFGE